MHFSPRRAAAGALIAISIPVALACASAPAAADVVAPHTHSVYYTFAIDNASAFPQCVFFAYPWTLSGGVPSREFTLVGETDVSLGRRSDVPKIWAMSRADYDDALAKGSPVPGGDLEAFFTRDPRVHPTRAVLRPSSDADDASPVQRKREVLHVASCDAKGAEVVVSKVVYGLADDTEQTLSPDAPAPTKAGCGACASSRHSAGSAAAALVAALVVLAAWMARRGTPN